MGVSAHDVARELRRRLPGIGDVKLHKLLYYVQGWHLAGLGAPAFRERIEAWANGPVVAALWADERHHRGEPEPTALDDQLLAIVDYVVDRYGRHSGKELIHLTHAEDPWRDVSERDDTALPNDAEITHHALRQWFESDAEHRQHATEVDSARAHDPFELRRTRSLDDAIARARRGERVLDIPRR